MRILLDTHTFLWWNVNDSQLSATARQLIEDGENEVFVSAASAWEIAIKAAKGRLILPEPPPQYVANRVRLHRFQSLPISIAHASAVHNLPPHHNDPFDRLLIAQSNLEKMALLSIDSTIAKYDVDIVW